MNAARDDGAEHPHTKTGRRGTAPHYSSARGSAGAVAAAAQPTSSRWMADSGDTSSASSSPRLYAVKTPGSM